MALDTQNKRLSVIHLGSPWRGMLPLPDGSLASQADRQHIMFLYRGAEASTQLLWRYIAIGAHQPGAKTTEDV
jgi:hypothetical protein